MLETIPTALSHVEMTPLRPDDLPELVRLIDDPVVYANTLSIPSPYSVADANAFYQKSVEFEEEYGVRRDWCIRVQDHYAGGIGLLYNHGVDTHKSEFGYWLGKEFRGQGVMTACVLAFSEAILENYPISRLEAHVFAHNPASCKVLEKCGYVKEGFVHKAFMKDGEFLDAHLYALVRC